MVVWLNGDLAYEEIEIERVLWLQCVAEKLEATRILSRAYGWDGDDDDFVEDRFELGLSRFGKKLVSGDCDCADRRCGGLVGVEIKPRAGCIRRIADEEKSRSEYRVRVLNQTWQKLHRHINDGGR